MNLLESCARVALRLGLGPNAITTAGLMIGLGAAVAFAGGAVRAGGILVVLGGLFDALDGRVARLAKRVTSFGALYDATADRVGDAALCAGVALYFLRGGSAPAGATQAVMVTVAALSLALLAAYVRARAEGLGLEARVGLPRWVVRLVLVGVVPLAFGAAGLFWTMLAFAVVSAVTVLHRVIHVARAAGSKGAIARKRDTLPGRAAALRKGH
jgi:phosphatidylglycerophosphate synthase